MKFETAMVTGAILLVPPGLVMVFGPLIMGDLMGLPLDATLAEICSGHETAKMEMVRCMGGFLLILAMCLVAIRKLTDREIQKRFLQAITVGMVLQLGINLHTLMIGSISNFGWFPVVHAGIFLFGSLSLLWSLRGEAPRTE